MANIKGYWRLRDFAYTSSSSPALASGTAAYNTPTTSGEVFDSPFRLYYRQAGRFQDVPFVSDSEWLIRSATRSADAGYPQYARLIQTSATVTQIELNRPVNQAFIDNISTLTLEYWIRIVLLSANTDVPILPGNLRIHILPLAAWRYALTQGDFALADRMRIQAEQARLAVLKHDLTRTGRPRQLRPRGGYEAISAETITDYGRG